MCLCLATIVVACQWKLIERALWNHKGITKAKNIPSIHEELDLSRRFGGLALGAWLKEKLELGSKYLLTSSALIANDSLLLHSIKNKRTKISFKMSYFNRKATRTVTERENQSKS